MAGVVVSDRTDPEQEVTFRWSDPEPSRPALDVLIRLIAVTDPAQDRGSLAEFLMEQTGNGSWQRTLRLPADLRSSYQLCPVRDRPIRGLAVDEDRWAEVIGAGVPDPRARSTLPPGCTFGSSNQASILELAGASAQPWAVRRPGVPRGSITPMAWETGRGASRCRIWRSAQIEDGQSDLPLVVAFDGTPLLRTDVASTFDNLVADRALPPFVAVLVESIHGSSERGPTRVRSLTHPEDFLDFTLEELLPRLAGLVTDDPDRTVALGQSLGGLAAAWLGAVAPGRFGRVVGQSAALWWPGDDSGGLSGDTVISAYPTGAGPPVRVWLEAGSEEGDLLASNRVFRDALAGGGYDVSLREYRGGHDYACWRGGVGDGLVAALGRPRLAP